MDTDRKKFVRFCSIRAIRVIRVIRGYLAAAPLPCAAFSKHLISPASLFASKLRKFHSCPPPLRFGVVAAKAKAKAEEGCRGG